MRPLRVLVVDDQEPIRKALRHLLPEGDIEIVGEATNGADAIEQVERLSPDLVIMDFKMPVMPGTDATREIKKRWPDLEVVAYTSVPYPEATDTMREAGASQSFDKLHIEDLIDSIVDRARALIRILIVDDNEDVRGLLRLQLSGLGFSVIGEAVDGEHAYRQVEELQPDIVVMDFNMPQVNGAEATLAIKLRFPSVEVIGYTSVPTDELVRAGASASFVKSEFNTLVEELKRLRSRRTKGPASEDQ